MLQAVERVWEQMWVDTELRSKLALEEEVAILEGKKEWEPNLYFVQRQDCRTYLHHC